jgi:DNA-binding transcriptional MerR regulator
METQVGSTWSIGELSRRSGLPVKTIRYYSDVGVLPPVGRTPSGYRRYGPDDLARLDLVRTLRELGVDLASVRRVLERQASLGDVLALHAEALDAQARALRLRRAVLRAAARHGGSADFLVRAQRVTALSAMQRRAAIEGFLDRVVEGVPVDAEWWAGFRAGAVPELPEDPTAAQVDAWVELAELVADPDFLRALRAQSQWFWTEAGGRYDPREYAAASTEALGGAVAALAAGVAPTDPTAEPVVAAYAGLHARLLGRADGPAFRRWLAAEFTRRHEPRAERYWQLVAAVNGWTEPSPVAAAHRWLLEAMAAQPDRAEGAG